MRIWLGILILAVGAATASADKVHTVDGRVFVGTATVLSDGVTVTSLKGSQEVPADDVARIELAGADVPQALTERSGQAVVVTVAGEWLAASTVHSDGETVSLAHAAGELLLPIATVATIYLPAEGQTVDDVIARCEELSLGGESGDDRLLLVGKEGKAVAASGVLQGIEPDEGPPAVRVVAFEMGDEVREVPGEKIRAILLVSSASQPPPSAGEVKLTDGSTVAFDEIEVDLKTARLQSPRLGAIEVPRKMIAAVSFRSDRVVRVDALTPVEVTQHGLLDWTFEYRLNECVSGGPISLDGQAYEYGLGLHSFCELNYDLAEPFTWFIATVGIDDAARPRGEATLTVLGDGDALGEPIQLKGDAEAQLLRLDVSGVSRLTIRVDFGPDELDVADHVDLAEARLVK